MSDQRAALRDALEASERLARALRLSLGDLDRIGTIDAARLDSLQRTEEKDVLAFLKTFEQLQDVLSRRLLRLCLALGGDDVSAFSARSAFDRAESLGLLGDADAFFDVQAVRNRIAHDYPMSRERRAERIGSAVNAANVLLEEFENIAPSARKLAGDAP